MLIIYVENSSTTKGQKNSTQFKTDYIFPMFKSEMLKSKHELEFYRNCSNIKLNYIKHLPPAQRVLISNILAALVSFFFKK